MAAEWLRADQVQAMAERAVDGFTPSRSTVLALVAQDGRWRALVGALLAALPRDVVRTIYDSPTAAQHLLAIYDAAQAALDGDG